MEIAPEFTPEIESLLRKLADENEVASFCNNDPSFFIRWYNPLTNKNDAEYASFIAAMLSFGSRSQFIPKIKNILLLAENPRFFKNTISSWLASQEYKTTFPSGEKKFYRFYSYDDMQTFFEEMHLLQKKYGSLENAVKSVLEEKKCELHETFAFLFPRSKIVPKGRNSANKRIHMFLRWMVRKNSPVDAGLWLWYPPEKLLMPLDVHVMEEAKKLNLLPKNASASLKTSRILTEKMKRIWPDDPVRGDFALFGLGVSLESQQLKIKMTESE